MLQSYTRRFTSLLVKGDFQSNCFVTAKSESLLKSGQHSNLYTINILLAFYIILLYYIIVSECFNPAFGF